MLRITAPKIYLVEDHKYATKKVELAPEELEQLIETADEHLRTYINQASYYVKQGLKKDNKNKDKKENRDEHTN